MRFFLLGAIAKASLSTGLGWELRKQAKKDGSGPCRIAPWQWVFMRIEIKKNRPSTEIGKQLGEQLDREKQSKKPVSLIRARIASKAAKLLFRALVEQLQKSEN